MAGAPPEDRGHDTVPFFGELYLRSTLPFLAPAATAADVAYLVSALAHLEVPGPVLDVGCGHGRHAAPLSAGLGRPIVGVDLDPLSLREREPGFHAVRADFFELPLPDQSVAAVYAWYSTLFIFDDERQLPLFRELARVLKPGGRFIFQTVPYDYAAAHPSAHFDGALPDGSHLHEDAAFDPATGRDVAFRRLTRPDGSTLSAHFFIRYYPLPLMKEMLRAAGFEVVFIHGGTDGSPLASTSTDLIVGADRTHG